MHRHKIDKAYEVISLPLLPLRRSDCFSKQTKQKWRRGPGGKFLVTLLGHLDRIIGHWWVWCGWEHALSLLLFVFLLRRYPYSASSVSFSSILEAKHLENGWILLLLVSIYQNIHHCYHWVRGTYWDWGRIHCWNRDAKRGGLGNLCSVYVCVCVCVCLGHGKEFAIVESFSATL